MTHDGKARSHFPDDRGHRTRAHIHEDKLEFPERLRGQALQALAQTLRASHGSHDDRDGGIQFRALFTGSGHGNDKFPILFGD